MKLYKHFIHLAFFVTFLSSVTNANAALSCSDLFSKEPALELSELPPPSRSESKEFWGNRTKRIQYLNWFARANNIRTPEDWYKVNIQTFYSSQGTGLLKKYNHNVYEILADLKPELGLKAWLFPRVPSGFWSVKENRKDYIDWLAVKLNIRTINDWYNVTTKDFKDNNASAIFKEYDSLVSLIKDLVPEHNFLPWKFKQVPSNYWVKRENRLEYAQWLGKKLGFKRPEDWYGITIKLITENHGRGLLKNFYDYSPFKMVQDLVPNYSFKAWLFGKTNSEFWNETKNIREYLDWLGDSLGYDRMADWYLVTRTDFNENHGSGLLSRYTYREILERAYPNYNWVPWKFGQLGANFWREKSNRQQYIQWLGQELGFSTVKDWGRLTMPNLANNHGLGIYDYYGNNILRLLKDNFGTDFDALWLSQARGEVAARSGYWFERSNRVRALEELGEKLGFKNPEDWYQIKTKDLVENGLVGLLNKYEGSPHILARDLYPDFNWIPWKFNQVPKGFWNSIENQRTYVDWLGLKLGIEKMEDWYSVSSSAFHNNNGGFLIGLYGNAPRKILQEVYPEFKWKHNNFLKMRRGQQRLYNVINQLFPGEVVLLEHKTDLRFDSSNIRMEIDIFLPNRNLGFEYQGEQHFIPAWSGVAGLKKQQARDQEKREAFEQEGFKVLEIDYTWDRSKSQIIDAINAFDPSILNY